MSIYAGDEYVSDAETDGYPMLPGDAFAEPCGYCGAEAFEPCECHETV